MTENFISQIERQLPDGEKIDRMYRAFEGDIRVITRDRDGNETRYTCSLDKEQNVTIRAF